MISISMMPEKPLSSPINSQPPILTPKPPKNTALKIVVIVLGVLMLIFAVMAGTLFGTSARAVATLEAAKKKANDKGHSDQKQADEENYKKQNESPFRSYTAPEIYGGFEIKFPKNWNGYVIESPNAQQQINLTVNPDFVKQIVGSDNVYGLHVILAKLSYDQTLKQHQDDVKQRKLKQNSVTVSGITGTRYEGKFDERHDGSTVVIPVRDKTIIISTDDKKYLPEYNQVLAQAHIVP